jgi:type II secretory pathway component PulF
MLGAKNARNNSLKEETMNFLEFVREYVVLTTVIVSCLFIIMVYYINRIWDRYHTKVELIVTNDIDQVVDDFVLYDMQQDIDDQIGA